MNLERVKSEAHTRSFQLQLRGKADEKRRTVELAFSSEEPYKRWFGLEILDHSVNSIRLDRISSRAPLLLHHDHRDQVGVVESVSIDADRTARAVVRFGNGKRASEIFKDVLDGIRSQVSVGYFVHDMSPEGSEGEEDVYRVTDWEPFEISIVSVAADHTVGVGRSEEVITMDAENKQTRSQRRQENQAAEQERQRAAEILAIGEEFNCSDIAATAVTGGDSVEQFRAACMERMKASSPGVVAGVAHENFAGMPADNSQYGRALERVGLREVILTQVKPEKFEGGLVREISRDLERSMGRQTDGLFFPLEGLQQARAVTYSGTGSNLVGTDHRDDQFIDLLRNHTRVIEAGARQLTGLQGNVAIPLQDGASTGTWFAGDDADSISESNASFGQKTLEPHFLGYISKYSLRTLTQASPDIEMLVKNDQARGAGVTLDAAALNGSGTGAEPLGLLGTSGIGSTTYANGATPTRGDIVNLETTIEDENAESTSRAYLLTPALKGELKNVDVNTDTGVFVYQDGSMNGYRALSTKNIPAGYIVFGNWSDLVLGTWGGLEVLVNPYGSTDFAKGTVAVRSILTADFVVRQPGAFAEIHEAAP